MKPAISPHTQHDTPTGVAYGLTAYLWWGITPLYIAQMRAVPPLEILAHRLVFSTIFLIAFLVVVGRGREIIRCLGDSKLRLKLAISAALVGSNWFIYILAVNNKQTVETALGYFINPLLNVVLGAIIFSERMRRWQIIAIVLAASGVAYLILQSGTIPWVALLLAGTFGLYGAIRKTTPADGLLGLTVESIMLFPVAVGYLLFLAADHKIQFASHGVGTLLYVIGTGVVLTFPMVCFGYAARQLRLTTLGFLQYISPTLQFILAVTILGEDLDHNKLIAFIIVWIALAIYTIDTIFMLHGRRRARILEESLLTPA